MDKERRAQDETVLLVDDRDRFTGRYASRAEAHRGDGLHHRAFVCVLFDRAGRVLLQRRRHWLWDGLWDLTAVSHVLYRDGRRETYAQAAARALRKEMGILGIRVRKVTGFNYFAKHPTGDACENEYCAVLVGRYDGPVRPDPEDVYEYRWMAWEDFVRDVKARPEAYTPWTRLSVEVLAQSDWKLPKGGTEGRSPKRPR